MVGDGESETGHWPRSGTSQFLTRFGWGWIQSYISTVKDHNPTILALITSYEVIALCRYGNRLYSAKGVSHSSCTSDGPPPWSIASSISANQKRAAFRKATRPALAHDFPTAPRAGGRLGNWTAITWKYVARAPGAVDVAATRVHLKLLEKWIAFYEPESTR